MTLRGRIVLLGLMAFAGLAIMLGQNLFQFWRDYQHQAEFGAFVERVAADVDVVHQLQRERGLTAAYLGDPGAETAQALEVQRAATDQALQATRNWTGAAEADGLLLHR
ncbi:MAG TPA: nitrate- and nitrite sensing domain-containing protein, partial [Rhodocyclaceae bacterium]|nr:nitrate- and nitrite sensing domain-containing protein [Rhodocyclaceae bacterium]